MEKTFQVKSDQYPVRITQKLPGKVNLRSKNPKNISRGCVTPDPTKSLRLRRSIRKTVSIYLRSAPGGGGGFKVKIIHEKGQKKEKQRIILFSLTATLKQFSNTSPLPTD